LTSKNMNYFAKKKKTKTQGYFLVDANGYSYWSLVT